MSKKNDALLLASFSSRRDPVKLAEDMAETPMAQLAAQIKESSLIPIAQIVRSPFQSRVEQAPDDSAPDEDYIADLAATIERDGLLNPILVRVLPSGTEIGPERLVPYYGTAKSAEKREKPVPYYGTAESGEEPQTTVPYYGTPDPALPIYELIAGEHRVQSHVYLERDMISAKVLRVTDVEAARALTVENLVHKGMTDYELYLHMVMLRTVGAASLQKELAPLLGCSRGKVAMLECYARLPRRVHDMLRRKPGLIGANQVQMLASKGYLNEHPEAVVEAVEKVAEEKISQGGMVGFIERRLRNADESQRREYSLSLGRSKVRVVTKAGETRITGDVDEDALRGILQEHLERLLKRPDESLPDENSA